ncbi:hypothetical protein QTP81_13275 [Alteromonas sp. ASW11-36]|uniref:Type IV pilus biogenesis protein PilP n=1 Tax=Alteromonas arenosi TaxID=3055817 RepID=A0ABT7SZE5_9ALTE|nr:hypothetical protein [Alteromonas sp. ASW11-36]MDM7861566.1 hypothetical protein [Alteromonas sp. ASW11-36]
MKFSIIRDAALITVFSLSIAATANAQQSIEEAISQCSKETNSLQRLVCFDRLAKTVREYTGAQQQLPTVSRQPAVVRPSTPAASVAAPEVQQQVQQQAEVATRNAPTAEEEFGLEHKRDTDAMISKLYAQISSISTNQRRKRTVTLDNGQQWQQQDGSTLKISVGDTIYIERGVLGAFYMSTDDVNKRMKVKRVN